jgi:phage-related protein
MANTEVGSGYISIIPSLKGFNSNAAFGAFSGMKLAALGVTASVAAIGSAVVAVGKQAFDSYANFEQLSGGVQKIFGSASDQVMKNAQDAYAIAGVSMNQYMDQLNSMGAALKQSFGGDVVKAAAAGNMAITDMADNASIFGTNLQSVQDAYQGFAKQNYTMLDNLKLGYGGTKTEMERLIKDANEFEKANGRAGDLTIEKYGDVVQAIHDIQEQQGIMGNSAHEASETIQGSIQTMKAAWENWLTAIADPNGDIEGMSEKLLQSVGNVAKNVIPTLVRITKGLVAALPGVISGVGEQLGNLIRTVIGSIDFKALAQGIAEGLRGAFDAAVSLLGSLPELAGGIAQNLSGLFEGVDLSGIGTDIADSIYNGITGFMDANKVAIDQFIDVTGIDVYAIFGALEEETSSAIDFFSQLGESISNVLSDSDAMNQVGEIFQSVGEIITTVLTGMIDLTGSLYSILQPFIDPLIQLGVSILPVINAALGLLNGAFNLLISVLQGVFAMLQPVANILGAALSVAIQALQPLLSAVSANLSNLGSAFTILGNIAYSIFSAIGAVMSGFAAFAQSAFSAVSSALSAVGGAFRSFQSAVGTVVSSVRSKFQGFVDFIAAIPGKIVGFFSNIRVPQFHIPIPELHISGGFSLAPPSVPHIELSWHAKGAIFDEPYVFPGPGGLHGIGEAGPEAVLPIDNLKGYVVDAVETADTGQINVVEELRALRDDIRSLKIYMDGREVGGIVTPYVDAILGERKVVAYR